MTVPSACPCGGGPFAECCGPILDDASRAATAEQVMRSRYAAFVLGDGGPGDVAGIVEFEARFRADGARQVMRERSRFVRRAARWLYVEAEPQT